ncbi:MAG: hypothetical protein IT359_19980 [Gemmatimonadaceae bacterium]|nr:hypothetical protein [Gemmatimonadaceae bacterium]
MSGLESDDCGRSATVQATAQSNYSFKEWFVDGSPSSGSNPYSFPVTKDMSVVASFSLNPVSYTVTVTSSPANGGSTSGGGSYIANTQATLTATPASGFTFVNWTENSSAVSTNASYQFTVTSNRTLVATFTPITFTIATSSNPANGGTTTGGGTFSVNAPVTVTATPSSGYAFANWTENGLIESSSATYSFAASAHRTLVANFTLVPVTYTIATSSAPANGGSTSGGGSYVANSQVTVTAVPTSGWRFVSWTENGTVASTAAAYTFAATANRSLTANFAPIVYTIATSSAPANGGSTSGGGSYNANSQATVVATAANGFSFVNWTENGTVVSTSASYTFTVIGNRVLVATFSANPVNYTITTSSSPTSGGSTTGGGTYSANAAVSVSATPAAGYSFVNWTENGIVVSANATYNFVATANRALVANFALLTYAIVTNSNPPNGGTTSGAGTFAANSQATVVATSAGNYTFANWTENGGVVSTNASYSFTVTRARTLVANFTVVVPTSITVSPRLVVLAPGGTTTLSASTPPSSVISRLTSVATASGLSVTGVAPGVSDIVATAATASDSARAAVVSADGFALVVTTQTNTAFPSGTAGGSVNVSVWLLRPVGGTGDIGSIQGSVQWDPSRLTLQTEAGNAAGWTWIANTSSAATGTLGFAAFSPSGSSTQVLELARLTFSVAGGAGGSTATLIPSVSAAGSSAGSSIKTKIVLVGSAIRIN